MTTRIIPLSIALTLALGCNFSARLGDDPSAQESARAPEAQRAPDGRRAPAAVETTAPKAKRADPGAIDDAPRPATNEATKWPLAVSCPAGTRVQDRGDEQVCRKPNKPGDPIVKHGPDVFFFPDGKKQREGQWADGEKTGTWLEYYANGRRALETEFQGGKENGREAAFYEDGKKKYECTYRDGKEQGEQRNWRPDGTLSSVVQYDHGRATKTVYYRPDGTSFE